MCSFKFGGAEFFQVEKKNNPSSYFSPPRCRGDGWCRRRGGGDVGEARGVPAAVILRQAAGGGVRQGHHAHGRDPGARGDLHRGLENGWGRNLGKIYNPFEQYFCGHFIFNVF